MTSIETTYPCSECGELEAVERAMCSKCASDWMKKNPHQYHRPPKSGYKTYPEGEKCREDMCEEQAVYQTVERLPFLWRASVLLPTCEKHI